jgi:hypothetical protein
VVLPPELRDNSESISTARGQGGSMIVNTPLLEMTTRDAGILNFSYGTGNTGSIFIEADLINLLNTVIGSFTFGSMGDAGDIRVEADSIALKNGGAIISQNGDIKQDGNNSQGNAGNIQIITTDSFSATGSFFGTDNNGQGKYNGGDIY